MTKKKLTTLSRNIRVGVGLVARVHGVTRVINPAPPEMPVSGW